ncbi:TRAP transporter substrate-binding protein DctP [Marinobacter caseinilyticus]|uniref:TRAP transporter substrate-binding protein n=1 Tax=Marinobacter caseinilyticus TaxID=2692195 RepID=UPI00140BA62D|nr:TRAP transporter substrate-binding protein DctP [Marinobacter caseinilyticus]
MTPSHFWSASLILACLLALGGCSDSQDGSQKAGTTEGGEGGDPVSANIEPVTWRFALEEIEGSVQDVYAQEFKRQIEDLSDEHITIEIYPYGSLGTSPQLTELLQDGSIDLAFASPGHLASVIPEVGIFSLHFVLSDNNNVNKSVLSSRRVQDLFAKPYADQNLKLLAIVPEGWMAWTGNKPLRAPQDFIGFRMRTMVSPIATESYRAYGATPSPMPYSEVYNGLQLRQIDGQVNPIFAIEEMDFYEVQEVMTLANHAQFVSTLVTNRQWYQTLTAPQRQWLDKARDNLTDFIYAKQAEFNSERLDTITENSDMQIIRLTREEREAFLEASLGVRDFYVKRTGPRGQQILTTITTMIDAAEAQHSGD